MFYESRKGLVVIPWIKGLHRHMCTVYIIGARLHVVKRGGRMICWVCVVGVGELGVRGDGSDTSNSNTTHMFQPNIKVWDSL